MASAVLPLSSRSSNSNDIDCQLRWPDIAWDASAPEKEAFEASYRPEMEGVCGRSIVRTSTQRPAPTSEGIEAALHQLLARSHRLSN
jgi:hypothetical protein